MTTAQTSEKVQQWTNLAQQLRIDSIRCTTAAGSGHPTSSMSAADLMAVLMTDYLHYDFDNPKHPNNDHLIFSKGHASPLLYSMYKAAGAITDDELMTLRKFGSRLEGHPTPVLPWVDVATGSLGQGLPIGVGIALAGKYLDKLPYKVWVLLGDSETAEGSIWEAFEHASFYKLDNMIAILDCNRLGQRGPTMLQWDTSAYEARAKAFGWHTIVIDGHNYEEINRAYAEAVQVTNVPTLIIARTVKGKGVSFLEDVGGWHGKALSSDKEEKALEELATSSRSKVYTVQKPEDKQPVRLPEGQPIELPTYEVNKDKVATRKAYGDALKALGEAVPQLVALDGEVSNSTYAEEFAKAFPNRYFEQYIAEQQMIAAAVGLSVRGYIPFASTFAAFLTRAYDFIRMAAISRANIRLCGSHAGVSIGEDGPSQMALEDLAMMRAVFGSTVLYPCDPNQTAQLAAEMTKHDGVVYMRTTRAALPTIYAPDETFSVGGSKVLRESDADQVAVIAAGITVHEALQAYDQLRSEGITIRVIDAYSVKPIDNETVLAASQAVGKIITVEDHWPEGGLGDAVTEVFTQSVGQFPQIAKLAVHSMPGSGTPAELIEDAGISAHHIVLAVKAMLNRL
ncbi:transketolase [Thermosporothrix hazakensis]|jgi:transketolase|uniref:Transketolase n=2 Tax=Thermosporothrix TaxID=768650 RepID=A0A326UDF3_THEHA|nr:transketolase [Thermosporothrix hazakensis]PZW35975.1 transketolase [Thermosporothrix hazakensis]BBH88444.1 transketolase [Thermosporothrix sp. COM3]GCE46630.1 transketolase [Thermosporothrix hazakensis]